MELTNSIPINFFACNENILDYKKDEKYNTFNLECKAGFEDFIRESGISKMNVLPNFHIGNVLGPTGYVGEVPLNRAFSFYLFSQPMFREISFFEISMTTDILSTLKTDETKDRIRKIIPLQTPNYPDLQDTHLSSWSPALGYYGSSIGIYSFEEKVGTEQNKRYFIGVHSGLHSQTYDLVADKLIKISYANTDFQEGRVDSDTIPAIHTYAKVIQDGNRLLHNMKKLAISNNRRLAYVFAGSMGLKFKNGDVHQIPATKRVSMIDTKKDYNKMEEILNWWPKGAPMYIHSTIAYKWAEEERNIDIEKRLLHDKEMEEIAIGEMYKQCLDTADTEDKRNFLAKFKIDFQERMGEAIPVAECDYNTFRLRPDHIHVYNGCCATDVDQKEPFYNVIKQLSIVQGYEIYNSTISKNNELKHMNEHISWSNKAGNGFVTVPMLERRQTAQSVSQEKLNIFFSLFNDIHPNRKDAPKQMKYVPRAGNISEEAMVRQQLYGTFQPNIIQLTPEFVYLSPDTLYNTVDII